MFHTIIATLSSQIWNICTTNERDLSDLVYHLYDPNNVGYIEPDEARLMLSELLGDTGGGTGKDGGKKRSNDLVQQLVGSSSSSSSFDIDFKAITKIDFQKFTKKQTTSLFLAFGIQKKIIENLGGFSFWDIQVYKPYQYTILPSYVLCHLMNLQSFHVHLSIHLLLQLPLLT